MKFLRFAALLFALAATLPVVAQPQLAFPGAVGWAATTPGGRGGKVIRVTTLDYDGPGSLKAALEARGPRIVVFEVGGVIDLGRRELDIREPFLTIAGQTAPSPGITIIRGGLNVMANDVVIRHIRVRTGADGQAKRSGWEADAINTVSAHRVIVDHCSFSWAVDENMSAAGPRFDGRNAAEWRNGTSRDVTFSYNLAAEGLADSSHPKGEHSKGSLVHDNVTGVLFYRNVWASNMERSPLFKGGAHGAIVNNLIFNPGTKAVHYNLMALEWEGRPYEVGKMSVVGNVMRGGPDTVAGLPFMMLGGDGDVEYHGRDNVAVDRHGKALPMFGRYGHTKARLIEAAQPPVWPAGLEVLASIEVETHLMARVGARPWDRDDDDNRVLFFIPEARGQVINDEKDVSAYPAHKPTRAPFVEADWDMATMEPRSGLYPGQRGNLR